MALKLVIFDFDGVIADSWAISYGVSRSFNPDLTEERYRGWFEGNIYGRLKEEVDPKKREERKAAEPDFFAHYAPLLQEQQIFRGMDVLVRDLAKRYTMVIVSSTTHDPINEFLTRHGLRDCFQEILGKEVDYSKEQKVQMALEQHGVQPSDAIMITDTLGDIREARKVGVESIAVTWGFHEPERLAKGEPKAIVNTPEELAQAIAVAV